MTKVLFIFIDGVGIGESDPSINPFVVAEMPTLLRYTNGQRCVIGTGKQTTLDSTFQPIDPRMGVSGRPQSGTGHATIITGIPVPQRIGQHYGPKPNAETRALVDANNLFLDVVGAGKRTDLLTAYPPHLLHNIQRGKTLPSSFQQSAIRAGLTLHTIDDVRVGRAVSDDWTGARWKKHLKLDLPVITPYESGQRLAMLAKDCDFAMMSHVVTDYIGHRGELSDGVQALEELDSVIAGVLSVWSLDTGLVIITSDHGNMERLGDRKHTENDVPLWAIGDGHEYFSQDIVTLADIAPAIRKIMRIQ